jgi:Na+/H+ antiporter NhaD/arsenite permease-like protein
MTLRFIFRKELKEEPKNIKELLLLDEKKEIKQPKVLKKMLLILALVVILFLVHSHLHIGPAFVAIMGAGLALLVVSSKKDPQEILEKVELSVLLFFVSLFIIVGGLESAGVLDLVTGYIVNGAETNLVLTAIVLLWSAAILSAIVDNIPLTVAMIPVISGIAETGLPGVNLL